MRCALVIVAGLLTLAAATPAAAWEPAGAAAVSAANAAGERLTLTRTAAGLQLTLTVPQLGEGELNTDTPVLVVNPVDTNPDRPNSPMAGVETVDLENIVPPRFLARDCYLRPGVEDPDMCAREIRAVEGQTLRLRLPGPDEAPELRKLIALLDRARLVKVSYVALGQREDAVFIVAGGVRPSEALLD